MRPSRSLRPGQGSQARESGRGRGASSHNQTTSRNYRNERDYQNLDTLPPPAHWLQPTPAIVQYNFHHHLPIGGTSQVVQTHSSTGYIVGDVFVPISSTITTTVSTESHMEYGSPLGAYSPASEPPEPLPSHLDSHYFDNVGSQFAAEGTPSLAASDGSGDYTGIQDDRSPYPPVMDVANDGRAGGFDPARMPDLNKGGEVDSDRTDLLPSDPSRAYLESFPDEAWLRPIPLRIRRASTFPLLGQYGDATENLADNLETLQVTTG